MLDEHWQWVLVAVVVMTMGGLRCFAGFIRGGIVEHGLYGFLQHGIGKGVFFPSNSFTFPWSWFFFCASAVLCYRPLV
jgi:hypothetical protein